MVERRVTRLLTAKISYERAKQTHPSKRTDVFQYNFKAPPMDQDFTDDSSTWSLNHQLLSSYDFRIQGFQEAQHVVFKKDGYDTKLILAVPELVVQVFLYRRQQQVSTMVDCNLQQSTPPRAINVYPFNVTDIQEDGLDQSMSAFNMFHSIMQGAEYVVYLTLSTLQQSVGSAKVFRHTVEQLLMRIFYAPSTVKLWRKSSRTFQRYLSDDRVFKIIANTNRCDWSRLFHSDFRRIACFSPPKANGEFPRVEYHSVESKRKNMHSSRNFEFFFDAHCPIWE